MLDIFALILRVSTPANPLTLRRLKELEWPNPESNWGLVYVKDAFCR